MFCLPQSLWLTALIPQKHELHSGRRSSGRQSYSPSVPTWLLAFEAYQQHPNYINSILYVANTIANYHNLVIWRMRYRLKARQCS